MTPPKGRRIRVDIAIPTLRLLIEFDGAYPHRRRSGRDRLTTARLEALGWTVIRVREAPLRALGSQDVVVPPRPTPFTCATAVLARLAELGLCDRRRALAYASNGCAQAGAAAGAQIRRPYRSFSRGRAWARGRQLDSVAGWRQLVKANGVPPDIPADPYFVYRVEWTSWGDFLGNGALAPGAHHWRPFSEGRAWARALGLGSLAAGRAFAKTRGRPADIPADPAAVYRAEWTSWIDWLGLHGARSSARQARAARARWRRVTR